VQALPRLYLVFRLGLRAGIPKTALTRSVWPAHRPPKSARAATLTALAAVPAHDNAVGPPAELLHTILCFSHQSRLSRLYVRTRRAILQVVDANPTTEKPHPTRQAPHSEIAHRRFRQGSV
jgi:hypothetical protein